MYPEKEFVNYMHGLYGEEILKHFMHAVEMKVPAQMQKDPTVTDAKGAPSPAETHHENSSPMNRMSSFSRVAGDAALIIR